MTTDAEAQALAEAAAGAWGTVAGAPQLIKNRENIVFEVRFADGRHAALRLHRPGYQSRAGIESELGWMAALAARGFPAPRPLPRGDGGWTLDGARVASCVEWLAGAPVGAAELPLAGDAATQVALFGRIGRLIGRLHRMTDDGAAPAGFDRPRWDAEGLLGARPLWGRFWENPAFTATERGLIQAARDHAARLLADGRVTGAGIGPIHADVLRENLLRRRGGSLSLIDFDDCGIGYRLYDLATAVVQSLEEPNLPLFPPALIQGYRRERVLDDADAAGLPLFVMLRTFASAGWIATRAAANDPRQRFYAARALRMARLVLDGETLSHC